MATDFTARVFALVDSTDASGFGRLFAPEGRLRFGNSEPMTGPAAIEAGVRGFFGTIKTLRHAVVKEWVVGADSITELFVEYDRLDGRTVSIPVVTIWHLDESGLIDDYRVYFDLEPVFA